MDQRPTRDEWRSFALVVGMALGAIAGYAFGLTDVAAWIALAAGALVMERSATFLTRRDPRPELRRPTLGVAMVVVALVGLVYAVGLVIADQPGLTTGGMAWALSCMTGARVIAVRATILVHPEMAPGIDAAGASPAPDASA